MFRGEGNAGEQLLDQCRPTRCVKKAQETGFNQREKIVAAVELEGLQPGGREQREGKQMHARSHRRALAWEMKKKQNRVAHHKGASRIGLRYQPESALADTPLVAAVISVESANNHIRPGMITPFECLIDEHKH